MRPVQQAARELIKSDDVLATTMLALAADRLGVEFLAWDPETIKYELAAEYDAVIPATNFNRLMAGVQIITNEAFYKQVGEFNAVCNSLLSGRLPDPSEIIDALEAYWGIVESQFIWPLDENENFSTEILIFVKRLLEQEGIFSPPQLLRELLPESDTFSIVSSQFSDSPELFRAISYSAEQKKVELDLKVSELLKKLEGQLTSIGLHDVLQELTAVEQ